MDGYLEAIPLIAIKPLEHDDFKSECPDYPEFKRQRLGRSWQMREISRGHSYLEKFFGMMDMLPPVSSPAFLVHNQSLCSAAMSIANANMVTAADYLHRLKGVEPHDVLDVKVTCDGT